METPDAVPSRESKVTLREVTEDTVRTICNLSVTERQNSFVAPNSVSIAQAYFCKYAWFRAVYADETPVGFIMLYDNPEKPEYFLWRMMTDKRYQGMGFGRHAMDLLIERVRTRPNARELMTSCVQGDGSPQVFYEKLGFELTGESDEEEVLMKLVL